MPTDHALVRERPLPGSQSQFIPPEITRKPPPPLADREQPAPQGLLRAGQCGALLCARAGMHILLPLQGTPAVLYLETSPLSRNHTYNQSAGSSAGWRVDSLVNVEGLERGPVLLLETRLVANPVFEPSKVGVRPGQVVGHRGTQ